MFLQLFFKDIVLDFLYFPIWWYTFGFVDVLRWAGQAIRGRESAIGLRIWVRNVFVPMYGQSDWKGRIISFIFRILILALRTVLMLFWIFLVMVCIALYLAWPPVALASFLFLFIWR